MDNIEMANFLLGKKRKESSHSRATQTDTITGVATSDSSEGIVMVNFGGDSLTYEDDQSVPVSTTSYVKEGDTVIVNVIGSDGTGKTPIVIGVVARGDEQQQSINQIQERADSGEFNAPTVFINSSEGNAFKNDNISTILSIVVYRGASEITSYDQLQTVFGSGSYIEWKIKKYGDADFTIVSSDDTHLSENGFKYTVSPEDVNVQCVFNASLVTPD